MSKDEDGFYAPKPEVKKELPKQLVKEGLHPATIVHFIDLGWHTNKDYPGSKPARKVRITTEMIDDLDARAESPSKGKPLLMGGTFTFSTHKKSGLVTKLMSKIFNPPLNEKDIENYNFKQLLGKNVMVTVAHKNDSEGKPFSYISGYSPLYPGMKLPDESVHELLFYNTQKPNKEVYDKLAPWLQKEIDSDEKKVNVDDASSY